MELMKVPRKDSQMALKMEVCWAVQWEKSLEVDLAPTRGFDSGEKKDLQMAEKMEV